MSSATIRSSSLDTETGSISLNAAFLSEIKEANRELWLLLEKLRHLCSRPISMYSQGHELVDLTAKLRELVALQFSLEEAYGYFENAMSVDSGLSQRAESLRAEHAVLFRTVSRLAELAEELWHQDKLANLTTIVPVSFDNFYDVFLHHERCERELLSDAWLNEVGTGD